MKRILQLLCCVLVYHALSASPYARMLPQAPKYMQQQALRVPPTFGKTHFIIGLPKKYTTCVTEQKNDPDDNKQIIHESYFSPDDDLQQKLIEYIQAEKSGIRLAIFSFTDKQIADTLCEAYKRGVSVELVVDASFLSDRFSKIPCLKEQGIAVYLYDPTQSAKHTATYSNIMHNKFVLFAKNKGDNALVWTGSFNFTKSARLNNQENAIVTNHRSTVQKFRDQFAKLKTRTIPYDHKVAKT